MVYIVKRRILSSAVYCQGPYIVKQCILSSAVYGQAPYLVKRSVLSSAVYWKAPYIVKCCMFSSPVYCQALYIVKRRILSSVKYCCVIGRSHSFPVNQLICPGKESLGVLRKMQFFKVACHLLFSCTASANQSQGLALFCVAPLEGCK